MSTAEAAAAALSPARRINYDINVDLSHSLARTVAEVQQIPTELKNNNCSPDSTEKQC